MNNKNKVLKRIVLFTLIMSIICLIVMLVGTFLTQRSKYVIDLGTMELVQLDEKIEDGTPIAIIDTTLGEIRAVLYPEYAPEAVKNFTELAESGYYDNTYVFHSEKGVYSAAGCPNKDGSLSDGYDQSRELVKRETHQNLWPLKGALCSLTTTFDQTFIQKFTGGGTYYCGSRFALLNTAEVTKEVTDEIYKLSESEELSSAFADKGGIPAFAQNISIFGQAYKGLDVIEALSNLETEEKTEQATKPPVEDIRIISVKIGTYSAEEEKTSSENK